ncbi:hypothetical protein EWM64_g4073 [Hericium alpestre]|uniref:Glucose-methanol-choline oxidoreductase C-terminal domain-containing protein n=1 Tax=Hericium alpestre TaxID=135208 RepID=A0A4Z0A0S5_9AGAM|nr:hypothetical protein EWM64_g4073 [Hericium alpestre]
MQKASFLQMRSLRSPQILELSGIGLKSVLEPLGIPVQLELPIGENVQDHIFIGTCWELRDGIDDPTLDIVRDPQQLKQHLLLHGEGKDLFSTGLSGIAYGSLYDYSDRAEEIYKAAKETLLKNADGYPPGLLEQYKIQIERMERKAPGLEMVVIPGFLSAPNTPESAKKYYTILLINNQCQSRGSVHITSTDPKVYPALDPHCLEQEADLHCIVEGTKFVRQLRNVEPFKDPIVKETNPGPEVQTDEQIAEWLKKYMSTTFHTACSLPMLPRDKGGVVDPKLKVYGTENIRVVDLLIIPLHFSSHPQTFVYAIGEKAADIIKGVI